MMLEQAIDDLVEQGIIAIIVSALRDGRLKSSASSIELDTIFLGQPRAQRATAAFIDCWNIELQRVDAHIVARMVECYLNLQRRDRARLGSTRLVWTGPAVPGVYPRTSRQIVRELIGAAEREIWLTAYWIAGLADDEGIVSDVIESLGKAVDSGIDVAIALDGGKRSNGDTNFSVLKSLWPRTSIRRPRLYTWGKALSEPHLKLHAKVLVVDRKEALVTSANLTMHALERSMELGVCLSGPRAAEIACQLDGLVTTGEFIAVRN
jgi:phosphatidylserine/phosphatidylglycerophosphate/cardiolipin synthase-like enzyme